ncbi:formate-dependent phosphoribosylglycinamide formyltransferase [Mycobacterium marinum]|uniref:formate-dependent phosphoribosylglycinamide formyltransferase n=1 Tax=Mycobacterium marinum TaxID=1781 RepID=UPI0019240CCA|nr:formate-dependent phosphoribosylglycinamide formyltransferase [Mycobacterium marinum]
MTDGLTEGHDEAIGKHQRPATEGANAPEGDKTTTIAVPPVGTPRRAEADVHVRPRVVLLGGGEQGRELTIALQGLGAEVIAVDTDADAPAHRVADQALVVAMTDADELKVVFTRLRPDFVVPLTDAVSVAALDALADRAPSEGGSIGLVPSARCVRLAGDREALRKLAADQLGLPTAPFWFVGSLGELEAVAAHVGYPLLVKPVAGADGPRRSLVRGPDEVEAAWARAVAGGPAGAPPRVWAETQVEVEFLVTLIAVCSQGPQGPRIDFCAPIGHGGDGGDQESWQPQKVSVAALDAAKSIAARIVKALGGCGVFGVELMVNGDEVYFADVQPFPRDTAWVTLRSQRLSVFELQARAILGFAVDTLMVSPGAARLIGAATVGPVPGADALAAALAVPESDVRVFGRPRAGSSVLGVALATAPDVAVARDRAREVVDRLNVRDSRG